MCCPLGALVCFRGPLLEPSRSFKVGLNLQVLCWSSRGSVFSRQRELCTIKMNIWNRKNFLPNKFWPFLSFHWQFSFLKTLLISTWCGVDNIVLGGTATSKDVLLVAEAWNPLISAMAVEHIIGAPTETMSSKFPLSLSGVWPSWPSCVFVVRGVCETRV